MTHDSLICARLFYRQQLQGISADFGILSVRPTRFLRAPAPLQQPEQHSIAFRCQFLDGVRPDFGMNAVDELPLYFGRQHRVSKRLPPSGHGTGELLEKMLDAAFTAAQMVEEHVAHEAPTQARSPAQRSVDIGGADDPLGNKVVNLPGKGGLQTIGNMPWHLLAN